MPRRSTRVRLYGDDGTPHSDFNVVVGGWLEGRIELREHRRPAAFDGVRDEYARAISTAVREGFSCRDAHREALSNLTDLLFGYDLTAELKAKLDPDTVNPTGFRTTLSQGVAKNIGENFVNLIVYALAEVLGYQDEVLVDKGLSPTLKELLQLKRTVPLRTGSKEIKIPIEGDLAVFSRSDPVNAIVLSAKTRLKEVFHIGTMWKMLFDALSDVHSLEKWGLVPNSDMSPEQVLYVFATADMVPRGGRRTQGPDVERDEPRNLIAMDASFFDYVFVSKSDIAHVGKTITLGMRDALFHELGCLIDLIEQKFGVDLNHSGR